MSGHHLEVRGAAMQTEARGEPVIHVHELDGECHTERIDPDLSYT